MVSKSLSVQIAKNPIINHEVIKIPAGIEQVACDGGHPSLGHPLTYYTFDGDKEFIECGYCDRRFVRTAK